MDSDGGKVFESGKFSQLYNKKPVNLDSALEKITDFGQLKIFPSVREAMVMDIKSQYNLKNTQYKSIDEVSIRPTPVQIAAIRKTNKSRKLKSDAKLAEMSQGERIQYELQNENEMNKIKIFTIAAETGSGKTWAYLASVLSKLKEDDFNWFCQSQDKLQRFKSSQQVRSVILVPTHELVEQVYENLQRANSFKLANDVGVPKQYHEFLQLPENQTLGLSIMKLSHGDAPIKLFKKLRHEGKIDVLVTTPGKITGFSKLDVVDRPFKVFKSVRYCVLDEADTLFDKSFLNDTTSVVKNFPNLLDLILVSATIPKEFEKTLSRLFPDDNSLIRVATPSLHKIPKSIKIMTLDADLSPYNGSKTRCLAQAIYAISKDGTEPDHVKRIIVFVNEKSEVEGLVELMKKKYNIREQDICGISGQVHVGDRKEFLEPFVRPAQLLKDDLDQSKVKILVTTDLLSRGLNFVGIKNVILLGLPKSSVELVHRLGRTGRMNQSGRAFIIVDKKSKKSWVKGLGSAILRGIKIG
ncbi:MRH4 [Candida oxycetoniae]|uniref:ATP-dependent RNA helicase n=1 Tax=Candida oxycetoniae TaxID=497107 RepID=A0AAI9WWH6_9ASCO|nr:MRH4 [Candida oxycetoniae]KAI3403037.2 MRH4 [Candida oxycetoniae]